MSLTLPLAERRRLAASIRERMDRGDETVLVLYEPGDATHYELLFAKATAHPAVGACNPDYADQLRPRLYGVDWTVSWLEHTPAWPLIDDYVDPTYLLSKLPDRGGRTMPIASAAVLAELFSMVNGTDEDTLTLMRATYSGVFPAEAAS